MLKTQGYFSPEHGFDLVRAVGVLAEAWLSDDGHAGVVGDFLQGLGEVPQRVLPDCPLRGKTGDGPLTDLNAREKLLASHVPHACKATTKNSYSYAFIERIFVRVTLP